jgi:hypothetical protein
MSHLGLMGTEANDAVNQPSVSVDLVYARRLGPTNPSATHPIIHWHPTPLLSMKSYPAVSRITIHYAPNGTLLVL